MKNNIAKQALESFLRLFSANVDIKNITSNFIYHGICTWKNDEDTQDIKWINIYSEKALLILDKICIYLHENNLNRNDKIVISEKLLRAKLAHQGWDDHEINIGIEILFSFAVSMYDDGEYADSFVVHF